MSIFKILKKSNPKDCCDDLIKKDVRRPSLDDRDHDLDYLI